MDGASNPGSTNSSTTASALPVVEVHMSGEFVYLFDKAKKHCQVGIPNFDNRHNLVISITEKGAEDRPLWRRAGKLENDLWLDSTASRKGITFDQGGGKLRRKQEPDPDQLHHIDWLIHFEHETFHGRDLSYDKSKLVPSIYLCNAFFYTDILSPPAKEVVRIKGDQQDLRLYRVAVTLGARITLDRPEAVASLMLGSDGSPVWISEPGKSYDIEISNEPPPLPAGSPESMISDFPRFYQVIEAVSPHERFDIEYRDPGGSEKTPDVPCMGGGGGTFP